MYLPDSRSAMNRICEGIGWCALCLEVEVNRGRAEYSLLKTHLRDGQTGFPLLVRQSGEDSYSSPHPSQPRASRRFRARARSLILRLQACLAETKREPADASRDPGSIHY